MTPRQSCCSSMTAYQIARGHPCSGVSDLFIHLDPPFGSLYWADICYVAHFFDSSLDLF